uniref:Uncharacterized protein n=1 Tax=Pyxicephalus adspersus TaxID=30357 RepID=A0AAV3B339_PYXAD|nr:TPA: hypothetical protein GDO54_000281 [Pyxicephalus adspersus]
MKNTLYYEHSAGQTGSIQNIHYFSNCIFCLCQKLISLLMKRILFPMCAELTEIIETISWKPSPLYFASLCWINFVSIRINQKVM